MQNNIRKAFEQYLINMPDGLGEVNTAFENTPFEPKTTQPYQQSRLVPLPPENPTFGDNYHREVGFYQIVLSYPKGVGVGRLTNMADNIKDYFRRGTTLMKMTDKVIVDRTPEVSPVYINDSRAEITIRIRYYSNQF